jgi:hypothetical protein
MKHLKIITLFFLLCKNVSAGTVVFDIELINYSDRTMNLWIYDNDGHRDILYNERFKGEKDTTIRIEIEKPTIFYFNDYPMYVHPGDTLNLFYQRRYNTGNDSLSAKGKNAPYYLFFYQQQKNREQTSYNAETYNDSLWMSYKENLIAIHNREDEKLKKYISANNLSDDFYTFASDEIKYQYYCNWLSPSYQLGLNKNRSIKIPADFYSDLSTKEFNSPIITGTYKTALRFYLRYLADKQSNYRLDRYSAEYLHTLYDVASKSFEGILKKLLLLDILEEYRLMNSEPGNEVSPSA